MTKTDLERLLTLDADAPELRRGIAEMVGLAFTYIVLQPDGYTGPEITKSRLYDPDFDEDEDIPDYPHDTDAALTLLSEPPHIIFISRYEDGSWHVQVDTVLSSLRDIWGGQGQTLAMACCDARIRHEIAVLNYNERANERAAKIEE